MDATENVNYFLLHEFFHSRANPVYKVERLVEGSAKSTYIADIGP